MIKKTAQAIALTALLAAAASCSTTKQVNYLQGVDNIPATELNKQVSIADPVLGPGDLLNIRVFGADMAALAPFNKGQYLTPDGTFATAGNQMQQQGTSAEASTELYLVNAEGNISFPMLGNIHVTGLTKQELSRTIADMIYPKYVKSAPSVDIRLVNFKVTVMGAVKNPGQVVSRNERLNVLEALALAGDLDIRGMRENVLLYRTNPDGTREVHRLNLHDSNLLLSPYFTLQQNDFIYVEPNESAKQGAWQMNPALVSTIGVVSGITSIAGLIVGIIGLSK